MATVTTTLSDDSSELHVGVENAARAPAGARPLALIAAALLVCNALAMFGASLVARVPAVRAGAGSLLDRLLIRVFHPTDAYIPDPELHRDWLVRAWVHWDSAWYALISHVG